MIFFRCIFFSKWLIFLLSAIAIQQILVALGTYFLGKFTNEFPTQGFQLDLACGLFICISLPGTILHYLIENYLVRASKFSQHSYLTQYSGNNFNHPSHFRSQSSKETKHDIMFRGGQDTINNTLFFFTDVLATSMNVILNTISVALVTEFWFSIVIMLAGVLGTFIIYLSKENISRSSRHEMMAEAKFNDHLGKSWDSIILGNKLFYDRWIVLFQQLFKESEVSSIEAAKKKNLPVALAGMVANIIVLLGALLVVWFNQKNLGIALAVLVMLPRSLQIVMHIQICLKYLARWKNLKEKLAITRQSLTQEAPLDLIPYILEDEISINNTPLNVMDLINSLKILNSGLVTISGENGTGKSNLLLTLKENLGSLAVYLPAHHQFILTKPRLELSSGEIALQTLEDIKNGDSKFVLLDEWDANLSKENRSVMTRMLHELSLNKVVVEVRHHR